MSPGHGKGCAEVLKRQYVIALALFLVVGVVLAGLLALFVGAGGPQAPAAGSGLDAATMQVAKGLYCPVCPGVPLDVCDTQACQQWRADIRARLETGETPAQIQAYFVSQYGERVLGAPRAEGLNLFVYALPAFAVAAGAALLYLFVSLRVPTARANGASTAAVNPYRERIESELSEHE